MSRTEKDIFEIPSNAHGNFYRHVDGGCYQVISRGKDTETGVEMVAYIHRYPLEPVWSFRTAENFDGMTDGKRRFTPITVAEAEALMAVDRAVAQKNVAAARAARRVEKMKPPNFKKIKLFKNKTSR
jgi:hypothetical protein